MSVVLFLPVASCLHYTESFFTATCSDSVCVFSLQYSEKALYNQLCFYRFIFDWEHALNKVLTPEERSKTAHFFLSVHVSKLF